MPAFIPFLMGMGSGLARLAPAAYRGYKTFRKARQVGGLGTSKAAQAGSGFPIGYQGTAAQRLVGSQGKGLAKGTGGTGLQGLMARGTKRFPGTSGTIDAGTGVLLGGQGVGDITQGVSEGDIGQTLFGIGSLALGTPLLARGTRMLGSQRTLKKKFPETAGAFQATGKEFGKRIPKGTTAVGLGGIVSGAVLGDKSPASEQVLGEPIPFKVKDVLNAVEADKANIGKVTVVDGKEVVIGSPDYKQIAQEKLDEAYKAEGAQGTTPTATADQIADVFTFDTAVTNGAKRVDESKTPETLPLTDLDEEEIADIANRQDENAIAGAKIKKKMQDSPMANEFNAFYNRITELTGGNDQTSNLLLFKFATGLMSGKTAQSGVRGFLDVAGQAGSGVADTALALYAKENDRRKDLAVAFLKAKEKQKGAGILKADKDRKRVKIDIPNHPLGGQFIDIGREKDSGIDVMFVPDPETGGTKVVPMKFTQYEELKKSPARLAKERNKLQSIAQGYKYANDVLALPDGTFGLAGKTSLGLEKVSAVFNDVMEFFGADIGYDNNSIDRKILESFEEPISNSAGEVIQPSEAQIKDTEEVKKMFKEEIGDILKGAGDGELDNLTKAKLIQTRMKYVLANANKSEDRLTRADVEDAAQVTTILGFTTGEREVRSAYKNLQKTLEQQFKQTAKSYMEAGGNEGYILSFDQMPVVNEIKAFNENKQIANNIIQNQKQILGTIE